MVYAQVKELAERGLTTASRDASTRRARTVYAITDAGREALRAYLCETASGVFRLDWPALLKVAFGHLVPRPVLLRHIDALAAELDEAEALASEIGLG
jgi:DNA-binding PadR family transcriptional regulator